MKNSPLPGLYVHVPFCLTKCPYCDFFSVTDHSFISEFLDALAREASLYSGQFPAFDSLYVGGGTPSVLSTGQMVRLLSGLRGCFTFDPSCEITVEMNPDDVTTEKLRGLLDLGVNRLSMGVQSFHDRDLAFLKRRHGAAAGRKAIESALDAGFEDLSIDLIYALPGQTKRSWLENLEQAVAYPVSHLSCYQFTVEEGTPFGCMRQEGRLRPASERKERDLFLLAAQFLESQGFVHYEVSNYARTAGVLRLEGEPQRTGASAFAGRVEGATQAPGAFLSPSHPFVEGEAQRALLVEGATQAPVMVSRHNTKYWTHVPYLGLGPSAHSFNGATRWWNVKSVRGYCQSLREGRFPLVGHEDLTPEQLRLERLYLGFRTREGVKRSDIEDSDNCGQTLLDLVDSGVLEIIEGRVVPTRKGYLIADHLPLVFS
jgi:oxygen-independent coproporphyrinogen III oxidase